MLNRLKNLWQEFKEFAFKGNMLELAVGVIIGSSLSGLAQSIAKDLLMPMINYMTGGIKNLLLFIKVVKIHQFDFLSHYLPPLKLNDFITTLFNFLLQMACIFIIVKFVKKIAVKNTEAPIKGASGDTEKLLEEIRDLLREQNKKDGQSDGNMDEPESRKPL